MAAEHFVYVPVIIAWLWYSWKRHRRFSVGLIPLLICFLLNMIFCLILFKSLYQPLVYMMLIIISFVRPIYLTKNYFINDYFILLACSIFAIFVTVPIELLKEVNLLAYWYLKGILTGEMLLALIGAALVEYIEVVVK